MCDLFYVFDVRTAGEKYKKCVIKFKRQRVQCQEWRHTNTKQRTDKNRNRKTQLPRLDTHTYKYLLNWNVWLESLSHCTVAVFIDCFMRGFGFGFVFHLLCVHIDGFPWIKLWKKASFSSYYCVHVYEYANVPNLVPIRNKRTVKAFGNTKRVYTIYAWPNDIHGTTIYQTIRYKKN